MSRQIRRLRQKVREQNARVAGPTTGGMQPAPFEPNLFTFGVSEFGGSAGLAGPGLFTFGISRFDGTDVLDGEIVPWFVFDQTAFGKGVLQ